MPPPTFNVNLKQRLAALSTSAQSNSPYSPTSSSSHGADSYPNSPNSTISKARALFANPPSWMKRSNDESPYATYDETYISDHEKRLVQDVLSKMIFQAGVDFETRPMVVLNASALPDPQQVSYDLLLARILSYLNLYVEADYTVVFFAAGSRHAPSWNWVWKAYRSLSRKYRKNLKQLYIVHSSFFSKMLFSLAGAIISPKFFRKIVYIQTLTELATRVPLTQIDIPPAVYRENQRYEQKITLPIPVRSNVFGVPLEDIMGYNGEKGGIPRVVKDAIHFLRESGLQDEGIFRRSPSSALLRAAQEAYDRGQVVSLNSFGDPHLAAVLLKKYLRDLPEPIFPESMYAAVRKCPMPTSAQDEEGEMAGVQYVRDVLMPQLVPCAYILLSHIIHLLHDVSQRSTSNRMDATNLAIVISPNLVKSANPMRDVMMCSVAPGGASINTIATQSGQAIRNGDENRATLGLVIALCIRRYYEIFDEVVDRSEAVAPWKALGARNTAGLTNGDGEPLYVLDDSEEDDSVNDDTATTPTGPGPQRQTVVGGAGTTKRHRTTLSNASNASQSSATRSLTADASNTSTPTGARGSGTVRAAAKTNSKARSVISIESASAGVGAHSKRGSIAIGRGTTRKGSGAAVEAIGVTAAGFFSPPSGTTTNAVSTSAPSSTSTSTVPVVPLRKASLASSTSTTETSSQEDEEPRLSVGERRRMFEGKT